MNLSADHAGQFGRKVAAGGFGAAFFGR
jgi:hypothetical protein